jgi:3-deoxy-7-phosphoheptulonate synthase
VGHAPSSRSTVARDRGRNQACRRTAVSRRAYKPRTSPYSFQGLGEPGLEILARVQEEFDLPVITEAIDQGVGASGGQVRRLHPDRRAQHAELRAAESRRTRAKTGAAQARHGGDLEELLLSANIMSEGNYNVILCERGVRTFADHTRNTLDLSWSPQSRE